MTSGRTLSSLSQRFAPVALVGWLVLLAAACLLLRGEAPHYAIAAWMIMVSGVPYVAVVVGLWRRERLGKAWWGAVLGVALAARLVALTGPPALSDDVYRYVWEGRVVAAGLNPFALAPDSLELADLRDDVWDRVNNREISAIYPPLNQAAFGALARLGASERGFRVAAVGVEALAVLALWGWLRRRGLPEGRAAVWLLHPLAVVEVAGNGHLDIVVVLGLAVTLWGLAGGATRDRAAAVAGWCLATGGKLLPAMALAHLARTLPRRWWLVVAGIPLVVMLSYAPFAEPGGGTWRALDHYESRWRNNDSVFGVVRGGAVWIDPTGARIEGSLRAVVGDAAADRLLKRRADTVPTNPHDLAARLAVYALFGVWWIVVLVRMRGDRDPSESFLDAWGALYAGFLLLGPVNHPWYFLALVPCAMARARPALLWWTMAVPATYSVLDGWVQRGEWVPSRAAWWLQYGGLMAFAAWSVWRWRFPICPREGELEE